MFRYTIAFSAPDNDKAFVEHMQAHAESLLDHFGEESPFEITVKESGEFFVASDDLALLGKLLIGLSERIKSNKM